MGSLLFFLGGKNIVYPLWQSSFVKVSGNQIKTKNPKSNKTISIILIGIVIALSLPIFIGGEPLIGFWLINIGLLSSAILEWRKWIDSITV
jgi:hypothetical protein